MDILPPYLSVHDASPVYKGKCTSDVGAAHRVPLPHHNHTQSTEAPRDCGICTYNDGRVEIWRQYSCWDAPTWYTKCSTWWWDLCIKVLQHGGPTCIKLCQYASTRQDLFSFDICAKLGQLREQNTYHSWDDTEDILRRSVGEGWHHYIHIPLENRNNPIGSGCIAQVYQGYVYSGEDPPALQPSETTAGKGTRSGALTPAAIKVVHPSIARRIGQD
uniref:Putative aarF domain-containing protein kinase 2 n=3 Tax=Lygus hesperus TaxID=30085 RepID=A0A146KPI7_LYGHE